MSITVYSASNGPNEGFIEVSRLLGRMYSKKAFQGNSVNLRSGVSTRVGEKFKTEMIPGRKNPESAVPMYALEGVDRIDAVSRFTHSHALGSGVAVANSENIAAAVIGKLYSFPIIYSACTCSNMYCCPDQIAAIYTALTIEGIHGVEKVDEFRTRLEKVLETSPDERTLEDLLIACDSGYLMLKEFPKETIVSLQNRELKLDFIETVLSNELQYGSGEIGPRSTYVKHLLGDRWGPEKPILNTPTADVSALIAEARKLDVSPASLILGDE